MSSLEKPILTWFKKNKRDLPWRDTTPWGVMVSEYMLQQTPVNRVLPKWNEWMERWPTPKDLAKATPAQVITAWGRLGYPRRALRLHVAAQIIAEDFNNKVPEDQETLQLLPGIGEYTAAAIAAFVNALNNVDLPTFGRPTIPQLKPMKPLTNVLFKNCC